MSAQNIIELGFNVQELSEQKKQVLDLFVDMFGKLKEYDGTKFNPLGGGGLADLKKSLVDGTQAMNAFQQSAQKYNETVTQQAQRQAQGKKTTDDLTLAMQAYQRITDQLSKTQAQSSANSSNAAENLAIEKELLKQRNVELGNAVKALVSETGSIAEAKAAVAQLIQQRDKLNLSTEEGKAKLDEFNAAINKNNDFIKANVSSLEKQKINIGNYPQIVGILESSLAGVNSRLDGMAKAGDTATEAYQRLVLEQKILQGTLDRQQEGFSNINQALRSTKNALDAMEIAGLKNTEAFEQLNIAYTDAEQKIKDLHREQAILTSDAPALTALTGIAKGLGGTYALGAGAAGIFAGENEKLDKELNKLVAVMTFLQGLNEAVNTLKDRNAIVTALETEATKALVLIKKIEVAIFGDSATVTKAEAEAKLINTEVTAANTEAQEANAVGAEVNTAAMEGTAAATGLATTATIGFRTALITTGIGALIIGLIYGITKVVGAISDWINEDERLEKAQSEIADSIGKQIEIYNQLREIYDTIGKERVEQLTREGNLIRDAGKNQFIQLANEQAINDRRLETSKKYVEQRGIDEKKIMDLYVQQQFALETLQGYEQSLAKAEKDAAEDDSRNNKNKVEGLTKLRDQAEKDTKNAQGLYKLASDSFKQFLSDQNAVEATRIKTAKAAAEELAKLTADAAERRYNTAKDANDRILSLDSSTEAQRISATRGNFEADAKLASSKIAAVEKQVEAQTITEKEGADEIANIQNDLSLKYKKYLDDRLKIQIEYRDRALQANAAIYKNDNESDGAIQEAITKDLQKELDVRLDALKKNIDDRTAIINNDYRTQLTLAKEHGKTQAEIDQLDSDRQKALKELTASTQKDIYDITVSYGERRLKAVQDLNKTDDSGSGVTAQYRKESQVLFQSLQQNIFSYETYLLKKAQLDDKYAIDLAAAHVKDDQIELARLKEHEGKKLDIQIEAAQKTLDAAKAGGNADEIDNAQAKLNGLKYVRIKTEDEIVAASKKLEEDQEKEAEARRRRTEQAEAKLQDNIKQLRQGAYDFAKSLVDASFENQINKIQHLMEVQDAQTESEIAAIQRSTLSQQDQAAETIILQGQQKARDAAYKREQQQEKIKEAKFDRDLAVAEIGWNTAKAVMKDTAGVPFPLSLAIAASDIALGALQAAIVLARPIPTYGDGIGIPGKGEHPGGGALVGERYKPELVSIPGRDPFIVDRPTLLNMPRGSSVQPLNADNLIFDLGGQALLQGAAMINQRQDGGVNAWDVARWQTAQMKKVFQKGQRRILNDIHIHVDTDTDYMRKKIWGKA